MASVARAVAHKTKARAGGTARASKGQVNSSKQEDSFDGLAEQAGPILGKHFIRPAGYMPPMLSPGALSLVHYLDGRSALALFHPEVFARFAKLPDADVDAAIAEMARRERMAGEAA